MTKSARLGLFLLGSVLVLFVGIFLIGEQQHLFRPGFPLRTQFAGVSGLLVGAEVRIGGLRTGTVDQIQLPARPDAPVLVTLSIDRASAGLVKADSRAAIETEGLLGSKYLAISFGGAGAGPVKPWDTLTSVPPLDVAALTQQTQAVLDTTQRAIQHLEGVTRHLETLVGKADRGEGTVGALVNDRGLYDQLNLTARNLAASSGEARAALVQAKLGATAFQEDMQALKANILFRGFFKDRGYLDSAELTRWELSPLPSAEPGKRFRFPLAELFEKPSAAKLKKPTPLKAVGLYLEQHPFDLVLVQAFSGQKGNQEENRVLTQAQAMVVRAYLAERFELDDAKLRTKGMGETQADPGQDGWVLVSVYGAAQ